MHLKARNTNELQLLVYGEMQEKGRKGKSRNGDVLRFPTPVVIEVTNPWERVNFCPVRDANPFFHMMEGIAMIAAVNSCEWLCQFNKNMINYSDDGKTWNAFYGTRIRKTWGDQLWAVAKHLQKDPNSRQAVVQIWDPEDLNKKTRDKACNMQLIFQKSALNSNALEMTIVNRSNDAIWGTVTGANIVHFSMIHEMVTKMSKFKKVGSMFVMTNNLHVYTGNPQWEKLARLDNRFFANYTTDRIVHVPLVKTPRIWMQDANKLIKDTMDGKLAATGRYTETWIRNVAVPVVNSWHLRKYHDKKQEALEVLETCIATDWRVACQQWMQRRGV